MVNPKLTSVSFGVSIPKKEVTTEDEAIFYAIEYVKELKELSGLVALNDLPIRPIRWGGKASEGSNWDIIINI